MSFFIYEEDSMNITISDAEKKVLFELVKLTLNTAVLEKRRLSDADIPPLPKGILQEKMGAFVTYHINSIPKKHAINSDNEGICDNSQKCASEHQDEHDSQKELRGCIGMMQAQYPLWVTIVNMAYSAAMEDTRFLPISEKELPYIDFDITVLGPFSVCPRKEDIILGKHGIMLEAHGRQSVFLPQVPLEQGWNLQETFEQLCRKAGLSTTTWQEENTVFYWYEGIVLH